MALRPLALSCRFYAEPRGGNVMEILNRIAAKTTMRRNLTLMRKKTTGITKLRILSHVDRRAVANGFYEIRPGT